MARLHGVLRDWVSADHSEKKNKSMYIYFIVMMKMPMNFVRKTKLYEVT